MGLNEVVVKAIEIMEEHILAEYYDSGFDAGEFSGPAHSRAQDQSIANLAEANGFTFEQVMDEINRIANEEQELNLQEWKVRP